MAVNLSKFSKRKYMERGYIAERSSSSTTIRSRSKNNEQQKKSLTQLDKTVLLFKIYIAVSVFLDITHFFFAAGSFFFAPFFVVLLSSIVLLLFFPRLLLKVLSHLLDIFHFRLNNILLHICIPAGNFWSFAFRYEVFL